MSMNAEKGALQQRFVCIEWCVRVPSHLSSIISCLDQMYNAGATSLRGFETSELSFYVSTDPPLSDHCVSLKIVER